MAQHDLLGILGQVGWARIVSKPSRHLTERQATGKTIRGWSQPRP